MKIVTVIGARPQFIKAAALSRVLRRDHEEILVHTGQHYDANMSDIFFDELEIPRPDHNLGISGGSHGSMTGRMIIALEEILLEEKPDALLLYGDTNSTISGAIAASKLHIPIIHVEAGVRLGTLENPEEVNRVVTDRLSALHFCCTESSVEFLEKEGLSSTAHLVGDPMYDAFLFYRSRAPKISDIRLTSLDGETVCVPEKYNYITCHRQENTQSPDALFEILSAVNSLEVPAVYPVHPRNRAMALSLCEKHGFENIIFCNPVGYLESIALVSRACQVVTDSGGVQREAFFAGVQCVTVLDFVCWPETMVSGRNQLVRPDKADILEKLRAPMTVDESYKPFGDGHSCEKICEIIGQTL